MANTTQYAFRLPPEHVQLLDRRAAHLAERLGVPINRTDALKMLLEFAQKVESFREARIAELAEQSRTLRPGPERDLVERAREDWETMPYERILRFAEIQALGSAAVDRVRRSARAQGLDHLTTDDIEAEIRSARLSRTRRR